MEDGGGRLLVETLAPEAGKVSIVIVDTGPTAFAQDHGDRLVRSALVNGRILSRDRIVNGQTVLLADGRVEAITPPGDVRCRGAASVDLQGHILLPGFIDVQVNGGGGVLFNDDPSLESIRAIGAAHWYLKRARWHSGQAGLSRTEPGLPRGARRRHPIARGRVGGREHRAGRVGLDLSAAGALPHPDGLTVSTTRNPASGNKSHENT